MSLTPEQKYRLAQADHQIKELYNWSQIAHYPEAEIRVIPMADMLPCQYCGSGFDHAALGNCPQCGAPASQYKPMGMLMLKGITTEQWSAALEQWGKQAREFSFHSAQVLGLG